MKFFICLLMLTASSAVAQTQSDTKLRTSGACSPAVFGAGNKITISCTGVSSAKADQMITLMNRILTERLDISQVNSKLDQISSAVGNLNAALDPLGDASPAQLALLKEGDANLTACTNLMSDWNEKSTDAVSAASHHAAAAQASPASADDQSAEFKRTLGPQLNAVAQKLHALMPNSAAPADYSSALSAQEAGSFGLHVLIMAREYQKQQAQSGRPVNNTLVAEAERLHQAVLEFAQTWHHITLGGAQDARSSRGSGVNTIGSVRDEVANAESAKYASSLEARFISYRTKVMPFTPDFSSDKNYAAVTSVSQLGGVCRDLINLSLAYRQKLAIDLKSKRSGHSASQ